MPDDRRLARNVRSMIGLSLILLAVLIVTACSSGAPSGGGSVRLEGTQWRAVSIAGAPPVPRQEPTLAFAAGQVKGSGGCNGFGGEARIDSGRLVVEQVASTLRACADDRANRVEQMFMTILGSKPIIGIRDGRLVLQGDAGEVVLEPDSGRPAVID